MFYSIISFKNQDRSFCLDSSKLPLTLGNKNCYKKRDKSYFLSSCDADSNEPASTAGLHADGISTTAEAILRNIVWILFS
jgi:hypothetical protein